MLQKQHYLLAVIISLLPLVSASSEGAGAALGIFLIIFDFIIWTCIFWAALAIHACLKRQSSAQPSKKFWKVTFITLIFLSFIIPFLSSHFQYSPFIAVIALIVFGSYFLCVGRKHPAETRYATPFFIAIICTLILFLFWGAYAAYLEQRVISGENCDNLPSVLTTPYFTSTSIVPSGRDARNRCFMSEAFQKRDISICEKLGKTYPYSGNTKEVCRMILKP